MITLVKILFLWFLKLRMQAFKKFLVSYEVTNLFTNIPLQETIDIAISVIFNPNPNPHFIFNSKFYSQIGGVTMCFPLDPAFANFFMGFYKSKWLKEYNLSKLKVYIRYGDIFGVILAVFDKE